MQVVPPVVLKHCKLQYKIDLTLKNPSVFQHFNASCAEIIDFYNTKCYAAKYSQPRLRPRLHSQPCTANVTQPRLCPRLHIHACIAKVTQSRIRSQGYAAKVTQPRLRPRLHCQDYTSPGDIIQVSKHPLFGVARWSHLLLLIITIINYNYHYYYYYY